ncbi:hypothetical protein D1007_50396 [Hordeum vulgare]|nr:hypothetical protein D1007_50396 [Hordeum vulgare]
MSGLPPKFSIQVTEARSPDAPRAAIPADTAFNITLHAVNRRPLDRCYRHGEAVVLYSGLTVAWGRTPRFCLGARDTRDVTVVAWADDGVELPTLLRDQMAVERRAGSLELDVDLRMFRSDDGSARPTWMRCKVMTGGPKQTGGVPCTVFALQNWVSDVAPYWMQCFLVICLFFYLVR